MRVEHARFLNCNYLFLCSSPVNINKKLNITFQEEKGSFLSSKLYMNWKKKSMYTAWPIMTGHLEFYTFS